VPAAAFAARDTEDNMRWMLRSKIHQATVTEADLRYVGSITIDEELMEMVELLPGEKVMVVSNSSGARLETYAIPGPRGSGVICMNGAAAHLIKKGEEIIIMGFELAAGPVPAKQIVLNRNNEFVKWLGETWQPEDFPRLCV
jgi:aspartate 1-decarboxylase